MSPYAACVNSEPLDTVSLPARLRLLRTQLGLSQEQLARRLGVSFATVNRWESGRSRPSARAGLAIAELETAANGQGPPGGQETSGDQQTPREHDTPREHEGFRGGEPAGNREPGREPEPRRGYELPLAQSSFVGRERELAELAGLLTRSG